MITRSPSDEQLDSGSRGSTHYKFIVGHEVIGATSGSRARLAYLNYLAFDSPAG